MAQGAATEPGTHIFVRSHPPTSISEKYDFAKKITTHVKFPVTSQSKCVVIFIANRIGDPRSRISPKYSPR
jgi:hypothetical protein